MKRFIALLLCFTLFSLNACSSQDKTTDKKTENEIEIQKMTEILYFEYTVDEIIDKMNENLLDSYSDSITCSLRSHETYSMLLITTIDGSSETVFVTFVHDNKGKKVDMIHISGNHTIINDVSFFNETFVITVFSIYNVFEEFEPHLVESIAEELKLYETDTEYRTGTGTSVEWYTYDYEGQKSLAFRPLGYTDTHKEQQSMETESDADVNMKNGLPYFDYTIAEITNKMKENILYAFEDSLEITEFRGSLVITRLDNSDESVIVWFSLAEKEDKVENISISGPHTVIDNQSVYNETLAIVAFSIYSVFEEIKPEEVESIMTMLGLFDTDMDYLKGEGENIEWESFVGESMKSVEFYPIGYSDALANVQSHEG